MCVFRHLIMILCLLNFKTTNGVISWWRSDWWSWHQIDCNQILFIQLDILWLRHCCSWCSAGFWKQAPSLSVQIQPRRHHSFIIYLNVGRFLWIPQWSCIQTRLFGTTFKELIKVDNFSTVWWRRCLAQPKSFHWFSTLLFLSNRPVEGT